MRVHAYAFYISTRVSILEDAAHTEVEVNANFPSILQSFNKKKRGSEGWIGKREPRTRII